WSMARIFIIRLTCAGVARGCYEQLRSGFLKLVDIRRIHTRIRNNSGEGIQVTHLRGSNLTKLARIGKHVRATRSGDDLLSNRRLLDVIVGEAMLRMYATRPQEGAVRKKVVKKKIGHAAGQRHISGTQTPSCNQNLHTLGNVLIQ